MFCITFKTSKIMRPCLELHTTFPVVSKHSTVFAHTFTYFLRFSGNLKTVNNIFKNIRKLASAFRFFRKKLQKTVHDYRTTLSDNSATAMLMLRVAVLYTQCRATLHAHCSSAISRHCVYSYT